MDSLLKAKQWAKGQALEEYKQYQHAANLLDVDIEGDAALKQISSLEEKITDEEAKIRRAKLALADVEAKIAKLEEEKKGNASSISASNLSVRRLNQTLLILEQRRKRNPNNQAILVYCANQYRTEPNGRCRWRRAESCSTLGESLRPPQRIQNPDCNKHANIRKPAYAAESSGRQQIYLCTKKAHALNCCKKTLTLPAKNMKKYCSDTTKC